VSACAEGGGAAGTRPAGAGANIGWQGGRRSVGRRGGQRTAGQAAGAGSMVQLVDLGKREMDGSLAAPTDSSESMSALPKTTRRKSPPAGSDIGGGPLTPTIKRHVPTMMPRFGLAARASY
jgi:hypothetical protein